MCGKTIVCEGIDGSGKSTISLKIKEYLGEKAIHTQHPGSTPLGQELRNLIKYNPNINIDKFTEQILLLADLNCFIQQIQIPELNKGKIIVCDRSNVISGLAYGWAAGKLNENFLSIQELINIPPIDLLLIFLCDWDIAKKRIQSRSSLDKIELRGDEYFESVNKAYNDMSIQSSFLGLKINKLAKFVKFINSEKSMDKVWDETKRELDLLLQ